MSKQDKDAAPELGVVKFSVTDATIAEMREAFMKLRVAGPDDKAGLAAVHQARMVVKGHRVEVEKVREALVAPALAHQRLVNGEAKRITAALEPIEEHLAGQEAEAEKAKEARRAAAEKLMRDRLDYRTRAMREAGSEAAPSEFELLTDDEFAMVLGEAARKDAERRMERDRIRREAEDKAERERQAREAEAKRLQEEQRRLDKEREEFLAAQRRRHQREQLLRATGEAWAQEALDLPQEAFENLMRGMRKAAADRREEAERERKKLEAERAELDRRRREQEDRELAERVKREAEERTRREEAEKRERERAAEEERVAAEARRARLLPDAEKLEKLAEWFTEADLPDLDSREVATKVDEMVLDFCRRLRELASELRK